MEMTLQRYDANSERIFGRLALDTGHESFCYTLEDPAHITEDGRGCIAAGRYTVSLYNSPHFQRDVPLLHGVQGRAAIEMHAGNSTSDTRGCILVGFDRLTHLLVKSRAAEYALVEQIRRALLRRESVWITVVDKP